MVRLNVVDPLIASHHQGTDPADFISRFRGTAIATHEHPHATISNPVGIDLPGRRTGRDARIAVHGHGSQTRYHAVQIGFQVTRGLDRRSRLHSAPGSAAA